MYDFPFTVNSNLYHICHCLQDKNFQNIADLNIWPWNRSSRRITSPIAHWMSNWFSNSLAKKMAVVSQTVCVWSINDLWVMQSHILSALHVKNRDLFEFLTFQIFMKVTHLECQNNKKHTMVAKPINESLHASIWRLVWPAAVAEREQKQNDKDTIYDLNALRCSASYRLATTGLWKVTVFWKQATGLTMNCICRLTELCDSALFS